MPVHNYRVDPFTGADNSQRITSEGHDIPANSPFHVWLDEVPRLDVPSTITVALAADIVTWALDPSAWGDTYVDEAAPTTPNGSGAALLVGTVGSSRNRALVRVDLTGKPTTARRAFLRLYLSGANPAYTDTQLVGAHELLATWDEATVAWNTAPAHNLVAVGTATIAGVGWYDLDITDCYNAWQAGTRPNYGVMIKHGNESGSDSLLTFVSSDGTSGYRPTMYVVPEGALFTELDQGVSPADLEVAVNYERAVLRLPQARAGQRILVDYYGTGSPVDQSDVGQLDRLVGNGEDGDLVHLSGTLTLSGVKRYSSIYAAPGTTITASASIHPLVIGCTGDCRLMGAINLDGKGFPGGAGGAPYAPGARGGGAAGGDGGFGAVPPAGWDRVNHGMFSASVVHALVDWVQAECSGSDPLWFSFGLGIRSIPGPSWTPIPGTYDPGQVLADNIEQYLLPTIGSDSKTALAAWFNGDTDATIADLVAWLELNVRDNATTGTGGGGGGGGSLTVGTAGTAGTGSGAGAGGRGGDESTFHSGFRSDFHTPLPGGGGGGGGGSTGVTGGAGGAGGGGLLLQVDGELYIDSGASISAAGSAGSSPGGGGGAGGSVWIRCSRRDVRCTPTVSGGAGGGTGGAGAAGWVLIEDL